MSGLVRFTPRLCDEAENNFCQGSEFKTQLQKQVQQLNPNAIVKCSRDYVEQYRTILNEVDRQLFDELLGLMQKKRTGFLAIEDAIRFSHGVIDKINVLGDRIVPLKIETGEERKFAIRNSDLNKKCAIQVYGARQGFMPVPDIVKDKAKQGTFWHEIGLMDPKLNEDEYYLPWFFLDGEHAFERKDYCERTLYSNLRWNGEDIPLRGTYDSAVSISKNAVVIDYKTTRAPPFHPHVGYVRQVTSYGIAAEQNSSQKSKVGLLIYMKKLGKSFSIRHFSIDSESEEGQRNRERTLEFAHEVYTKIPEFESNPAAILPFRDSIKKRCKTCYSQDFCWGGGLEETVAKLYEKL